MQLPPAPSFSRAARPARAAPVAALASPGHGVPHAPRSAAPAGPTRRLAASRRAPRDGVTPELSHALDGVAGAASASADATTDARRAASVAAAVVAALESAVAVIVDGALRDLASIWKPRIFSDAAPAARAALAAAADPRRASIRLARQQAVAALEAGVKRGFMSRDAAKRAEVEVDAAATRARADVDRALRAALDRLVVGRRPRGLNPGFRRRKRL
jgi:hypothetical protein